MQIFVLVKNGSSRRLQYLDRGIANGLFSGGGKVIIRPKEDVLFIGTVIISKLNNSEELLSII